MTAHDPDDPILRLVSRLPTPAPDAARSQRVVRRCHRAMARRQRRRRQRLRFIRRVFEPAVVGGIALVYVMVVVHAVLRWRGLP